MGRPGAGPPPPTSLDFLARPMKVKKGQGLYWDHNVGERVKLAGFILKVNNEYIGLGGKRYTCFSLTEVEENTLQIQKYPPCLTMTALDT